MVAPLAAAQAADDSVRLSVVRSRDAASCPDQEQMSALVAALRRPDASPLGPVLVDVQFVRDPDQGPFRVTLNVSGARSGRRTLDDQSTSCTELAEAAALSIAMLLDPQAAVRAMTAPPSSAPVAPPASPGLPGPPVELRLGASGLLTTGQTATPAGGIEGSLGVRWGDRWQASVGALWLPARTFALAPGSLDVDVLGATAEGCWLPSVYRLHMGPCARLGAGRYQAHAHGFTENDDPSKSWLAAGLLGRVGGALLGPVEWRVQAGWMLPLLRRTFRIDGIDGLAFDPPAAGGLWASAGLEARVF